MKQLFAAALLLTVATMTAGAQVVNDETEHANLGEVLHPAAECQTNSAQVGGRDFDLLTKPQPRPAVFSRLSLSGPAPDPLEKSRPEGAAAPADGLRLTPAAADCAGDLPPEERDKPSRVGTGFRWGAAVKQSLLFLSIQHGYAMTQPKTRRDMHGPFFKDYFRSVRALRGWADGGRFFTNYVAHPMQGSLLGFVQVQNDPAGSRLRFGGAGGYWRSRLKALAWSAAWSTQFEVGPVSQASIGNVGLHGKQTYVDIVMTPTAGTAMLVAEDALDRYLIERIERRTNNRYARIFSRMALNPTRTAANLLRFKKPWHRDAGLR